jgi:DNA primase
MTIPFDEIKSRVRQGYVLPLCRRWLPDGKTSGSWWLTRSPWREDKNPSFGVHLESGNYKDFATGEKGDVIELYSRLAKVNVTEAAKAVAIYVGHEYGTRQTDRVA